MHRTDEAFARERYERSLARSQTRREAARRRRQWLYRRRTLSIVLAGTMLLGGGAALAAGGAQKIARVADSGAAMLRSGSSGPSVAAVQRALGIGADGVFGPRTRAAVKRYQRERGLAVDGIVGPQTAASLGVSLGGGSSSGTGAGDGTPGGSAGASTQLERIAECESGGNPSAISPGGRYRGKYQFSRATWRSLGGSGDPAEAPEAEQDRMAAKLLQQAGTSAWPTCG